MRALQKTRFGTALRFLWPAAAWAAFWAWAGLTGCQGENPLRTVGEHQRAVNALPPLQRPDGAFEDLAWLVNGPVLPPPGVRAEAVGGGEVAVSTVQLVPEAGGLWVRGNLRRVGNGDGCGHLDLWLLDANGQTLLARKVSFMPDPVPHDYHGSIGRSQFSTGIRPMPAALAVVRVRFHGASKAHCSL